jgi:ornithine cyclodeaminase/alanine dehydrogenase-like protein (mu-crystallin family)
MALWIREAEVQKLLSMDAAIKIIDSAMRELGDGKASNHPRRRHRTQEGVLHVMDAAFPAIGLMGLKSYTTFKDGTNKFYVMVYSTARGELEAVIEADWLGRIRTGAASAVAAKYLARTNSSTLGLVGAGRQASTQLEAFSRLFRLRQIHVFSRTRERLVEFCRIHSEKLGAEVVPAENLEDAVDGKDLVITATTAKEPFLGGNHVGPGCHVTAMGANYPHRGEIKESLIKIAGRIVVDDLEQAKIESGDIERAVRSGIISWDDVKELGKIAAGQVRGRESDKEITLFKSHGIALWDITVAALVVNGAKDDGLGSKL